MARIELCGLILRIETTVNGVSFFKHCREVGHGDGTKEKKYATMQKTIYSLPALRELLWAAHRRYLEFLSAIEDHDRNRYVDQDFRRGRGKRPVLSRFNFFED